MAVRLSASLDLSERATLTANQNAPFQFDEAEALKIKTEFRKLRHFLKKNILRQYTHYGSGQSFAQVQQIPLNLSVFGKSTTEPVTLPR